LQDVKAHLPYGYFTDAVKIGDGWGNLIGDNATNAAFINQNLYLSTDMDYTGNRHTRTLALQSINSIANRYILSNMFMDSGDPQNVSSYTRYGNLVQNGQMLIDNLLEVRAC